MSAQPGDEPFAREHIDAILAAFERGDTDTVSDYYAEDGVFIDPHYPQAAYRGRDEVREALEWALEHVVERPGLTVRRVWENDSSFAVEVDTHHLLQDDTATDFPQVFIIDTEDGYVRKWRSYLPFPPPED